MLGGLAASALSAAVSKVDVYVSGQEGYHTYRIPSLIRAANGDLLAFAEGRKNSASDTGDIDLVLKRSHDDGRTWTKQEVLWDDGPNTCGNPCPVLDRTTGTLWLLLSHNPGSAHEQDIRNQRGAGTRTVWVMHSTDHGATWSAPTEITASAKMPGWRWYATGPGVGLQLESGPHAGRLVVPCDHTFQNGEGGREPRSHAIYSDDHGATWRIGGSIGPGMNECQAVELYDGLGTLLMNMRSGRGHAVRAESRSQDGGLTWTEPQDAPPLVEPVCQASLLRWDRAKSGRGRILFSNPAAPKKRVNLTVRLSDDNAVTWPRSLVLQPGPAAYSSLVALSETTAGCLYENGDQRPYERLTFATFTEADFVTAQTGRGADK